MDRSGARWVATCGGGVSRLEGSNWTTYTTSNSGLADNCVLDMAEEPTGALWFATTSGASRFDGANWTTHHLPGFGPPTYVMAVAVDSLGSPWIATYGAVASFDGTSWQVYGAESGLPWSKSSRKNKGAKSIEM